MEAVEVQLPDVPRLLGVACILALEAPDRQLDQLPSLADEAAGHLDAIGLGEEARAIVNLRREREQPWESEVSTRLVVAGLDAHSAVAAQLPELEQWIRSDVHAWARNAAEAGLPET